MCSSVVCSVVKLVIGIANQVLLPRARAQWLVVVTNLNAGRPIEAAGVLCARCGCSSHSRSGSDVGCCAVGPPSSGCVGPATGVGQARVFLFFWLWLGADWRSSASQVNGEASCVTDTV